MLRITPAKLLVLFAYFVPLTAAVVILLLKDDYVLGVALVIIELFVFTSTRIAIRPAVRAKELEDRVRPVRAEVDPGTPSRSALLHPAVLVITGTFVLVAVGVAVVGFGG